jgi:hypothetical protein
VTVFPIFWQVDLKDNKPEVFFSFIPYVVNIAGRTNEGISRFGKTLNVVDR